MVTEAENDADPLMGALRAEASGHVGTSGGARLYYELYGSCGKTLLLLNGECGKLTSLGHIMQRMARLGYRILVYDSRGIGRSSCPPGPQTTRLLAADALAVVDAVLGRDAEFYLLGASLGGMVAQELLHGLVAAGRQSRVKAAFLLVTSTGRRWRPLPFRRARNVRRTVLPHLSYKDQADFDGRFPLAAAVLFSQAWLDAPSTAARRSQRQEQGEQQGQQGAPPPVAPTRRDRLLQLCSSQWRRMAALHLDEMGGVLWHMTAQRSHFLGPRRAAAIRAAGIKIGVGISTGDAFHSEAQQRRLAEQLGAEEHVVGAGHLDCCFLEGVAWLAGAALATYGDSRV